MKNCSLLALLCVLILSCGKKDPPAPAPKPEEPKPGNIYGQVSHYNSQGAIYTTELNSTTVTIAGTNRSTITDTSGKYRFANVQPGTYTFVFLENGTGLFKHQNFFFGGNGDVELNASVADTAAWTITTAALRDTMVNGEQELFVLLGVPLLQEQLYAQIFFGKTNKIDPKKPETYEYSQNLIHPFGETFSMWSIKYSDLKKAGLPADYLIYAKIYPGNINAGYWDTEHKKTIYTGTGNPYPTFTLTLP